ncbi:MAG: hypothetical protein K8S23_14710 [Candidatus Cloacimonetes bacterium]|nr:hypothetical protein [Candidatus Cloacimonadota bacterium]
MIYKILIIIAILPFLTMCDNPTKPDENLASQSIPLNAGWNWISFNVIPNDGSVSYCFSSVQENVIEVWDVQNDLRASYSVESGWTGELVTINHLLSYKVQLAEVDTLTIEGLQIDISQTPIELVTGWNYIAYFPKVELDLQVALSSLDSLEDDDMIKDQQVFSQYIDGSWVGSLQVMKPNTGYAINVTKPQTLIYPSGKAKKITEYENR